MLGRKENMQPQKFKKELTDNIENYHKILAQQGRDIYKTYSILVLFLLSYAWGNIPYSIKLFLILPYKIRIGDKYSVFIVKMLCVIGPVI